MLSYNLILLFFGLILVVKGADILVSCAISIGKKLNLSELAIGIVIVGFGTSLSELLVSIDAVINNAPDLSLGNIVGSNIANVLLVFGTVGLVKKLLVTQISNFDYYFHATVHILFLILFFFSKINVGVGILFIFLFGLYLLISFRKKKVNENLEIDDNSLSKLSYNYPLMIEYNLNLN